MHLVGFTIEIILRCTAMWTSNIWPNLCKYRDVSFQSKMKIHEYMLAYNEITILWKVCSLKMNHASVETSSPLVCNTYISNSNYVVILITFDNCWTKLMRGQSVYLVIKTHTSRPFLYFLAIEEHSWAGGRTYSARETSRVRYLVCFARQTAVAKQATPF